jgi:hypothetical protein
MKVLHAESADLIFYSAVRTTIHGIDHLRIQVAVSGPTLIILLLGVSKYAAEAIKPYGGLFAIAISVLAALLGWSFRTTLTMFNCFLREAVEIGKAAENRMIDDPALSELKMTWRFETTHGAAGRRGNAVFNAPLNVATGIAVAAVLFYSWPFLGQLFGGEG